MRRASGAGLQTCALRAQAGRAAFTLLEIMLAVSILALVVSSAYMTWSAALRGWKAGTAATEKFQRQRIVMEALEDLTQSGVFFAARPELYQVISGEEYGLGDTVSFVTASDRLLPPSEQLIRGLRRVTLALRRDDRGRPYLAIANEAALVNADRRPDPTWHALSADVVGFDVQYRNPRDGGWYEKWEETTLIPSALMFTVAFREDDPKAPPLVVTRAMDFPTAQFALDAQGQAAGQRNTTNRVSRRDVNLSESEGEEDRLR